MNEPLNFALVLVGLTALVLTADQARRLYNIEPKKTRMFVHVAVSVVIFLAPYYFQSKLYPVLLASVFIAVNFASVRLGLFKGMNLDKKNLGTVYYPIAFLVLVLLLWDNYPYVVSTAMLIMGLADPAAAVIGSSLKNTHEVSAFGEHKTFEGAAAMFIVASVSALAGIFFFREFPGGTAGLAYSSVFNICVAIGIMVAAVELISPRATDNLTVPLSSGLLLFIVMRDMPLFQSFMVGEFLAFIVAFAAQKLKLLTKDGAVATFVLGGFIFGLGGWEWAIPILLFFLIGSGASRLFASAKIEYNLLYEKSHTRDAGQVLANGGVALLMIIFSTISPNHHWYLAYIGSLTAATADTLATEIGVFSRSNPFSISLWKKVEKGMSGAVSYLGTTAGLVSAAMLSSLSLPFAGGYILFPIRFVVAGTLSGALGSLADSIIGGTFQSQYKCPGCGKTTERTRHCDGKETRLISGYRWINNDMVNLVGSMVGAVAFPLLFR